MVKTWKLWKRDWKLGIAKRWYILLFSPIVMFAMTYGCSNLINNMLQYDYMFSKGTIMDYYLYDMQGLYVYHFDPKENFLVPMYWFVFQIGVSYFIAYYAQKDLVENGRALYIASRDRMAWWNSKCLWCVSSVLIYFIVSILSIVGTAMAFGAECSLQMTPEFAFSQLKATLEYVSFGEVVFIAVILPFIVTAALCLLQLLFSFLLSPVVSFALMSAQYILAAYYTAWYLPGSFTMWMRSSYVDEEGLHPLSGCIIAVVMMVAVYISGRQYFAKKDIF